MEGGEFLRGEREESAPAEGPADVVLEILDLVEIGGPVDVAVGEAGAPAQVGGAAQAFAAPGEVPHATVVASVKMAACAGDVAVGAHARIGGVVEDAFAEEDLGGEGLVGDGRRHRDHRQGGAVLREERSRVADGDGAAHEVLREKPCGHGVDQNAVWCEPGAEVHRDHHGRGEGGAGCVEFRERRDAGRVHPDDAVVTLERDEERVAQRRVGERGRAVGVVEIATGVTYLVIGYKIDERNDRAHRCFMRQIADAEEQAALGVVLFGSDRGAGAVGGDGDRREVVGNAGGAITAVDGLSGLEHDEACLGQRG